MSRKPTDRSNQRPKLSWFVTPWSMSGQGRWVQQPVILVDGQEPFYADHPNDYISKLEELHDNPEIGRGQFYSYIGQLKDGLEQVWDVKEVVLWQRKR